MVIRLAEPTDADRIASLSAELGYPARPQDVARHLGSISGNPDHTVLIAADEAGHVVGWLHVFLSRRLFVSPFAELGGLVVEQSRRGSGVGRALLGRGEEWARASGCSVLRIRTNTLRVGAHDFYRKVGYRESKSQRVFDKEL